MTEVADKHTTPRMSFGRSAATERAYKLHQERSMESDDCPCQMCRLAKEQKLSAGVLAITSKKLEIVGRELERVEDEISFVKNQYGYRFRHGLLVKEHFMVVLMGHYARLSEAPRATVNAYNHIMPFIMDAVDETFANSPDGGLSSQTKHFHAHAMLYGEPVKEAHYTETEGMLIMRRGSTELEHL